MRTFSVLVTFILAFCRCSAPETCVRNSDCNDGEMCMKGGCFPAGYDPETAAASSIVSDPDSSTSTSTTDAAADAATTD